jgi:hypothetical protein
VEIQVGKLGQPNAPVSHATAIADDALNARKTAMIVAVTLLLRFLNSPRIRDGRVPCTRRSTRSSK